ncbi:MAG TPA: CDP-alcohol phosphatidyltransferase family protein [Gemmatimonadales bacterium]
MTLLPRWLHSGYDAATQPIAKSLIAARITPNVITTVGTGVLVASGGAFALGQVHWGGALLLLSGVCDTLDGKVARSSGRVSAFGAFYDSTLDRIGESALFAGIAIYFLRGGVPDALRVVAVFAAVAAVSAGLIVSYARARAEGLGLECKVGLAQRAERILGLGAPTLFFGAGPDGKLLLAIVVLLALMAAVTVVQRIMHVYRITRYGSDEIRAPRGRSALVETAAKGLDR